VSAPGGAARARVWLEAARPRTLVAGAVPVAVGTATAPRLIAWRFFAALTVSLALQVAANYANDLFDALKGVDTPERAGPRRAVASGLATQAQMKVAIGLALGVAAAAGAALAAAVAWTLLGVGIACMAAALTYSGGRRPYGSAGLGELFVFVFFGVVATAGSAFVQTERLSAVALAASVPVGLLAVAILVVNNLRDVDTDRRAGKRTLAVRLGAERSRKLYRALLGGSLAAIVGVAVVDRSPWPLLALGAAVAARRPWALVSSLERAALLEALGATARLELVAGSLLAAALLMGR
jgi:1,4-dihydroxy-2-naphthoate octaprenyltransferase